MGLVLAAGWLMGGMVGLTFALARGGMNFVAHVRVRGDKIAIAAMKWARENDCPWTSGCCARRWARPPPGCCSGRARTAARGTSARARTRRGRPPRGAAWARENGCPWDEVDVRVAGGGGHLEVLQWARENGCPWDEETCASAAEGGHLEVLQWARANGCPWDESTCSTRAKSGHLEVLQWAARTAARGTSTCRAQAEGGHLEDAEVGAREQRLPVGREDARSRGFKGIRRTLSRRRERRERPLDRLRSMETLQLDPTTTTKKKTRNDDCLLYESMYIP